MLVTTQGIVLNATKYGDSSLVVKAYTQQLGLQTLMVRGVRKQHSANPAALFQHLSLIEFVFRYREQREMQHLIESRQLHPYSSIPFNHYKSGIVLFLNELLIRSIREQEANQDLFRFLLDSLLTFDSIDKGVSDFHLAFSLKLTRYLGFMPQGSWNKEFSYFNLSEGRFEVTQIPGSSMDAEASKAISVLAHAEIDNLDGLIIGNKLRKDLNRYIVDYYQRHLPGFGKMKSLEILESLYS